MKVWYQGEISDAHTCRISILDHGLLYGDGVFEGIRITQGRIFRLPDHLHRLARSARAIGLALPYSHTELTAIVVATARAYGETEAYVRLVVTRGVGELGIDPASCLEPGFFCIVARLKMFSREVRERGLRMMTASTRRPRLDMLDPQVKSLNYLNNVLAKRDARLKGFDDALLLNDAGRIAEASAANVFAVVDDALVTPPVAEGALAGITRDTVLRCAREAGIDIEQRALTRYEVLNASEVFLAGSGAGLIAVASVDDSVCGDESRPVLARMQGAYAAHAQAHGVLF
jgi:branched-chain amino acid aminotransferase